MKRRNPVQIFILLVGTVLFYTCSAGSKDSLKFYIGSSGGQEHSIYLVELDPDLQFFTLIDSFSGISGGSYLAPSPGWEYLYAIDRTKDSSGHASLALFKRDPVSSKLKFMERESSQGKGVCHLHCNEDASYLFAANYNSGHASVLPLNKNGEMLPATSVVIGEGSGPVESRQKGPHAHQVVLDPGQNFLFVPDLGCDRVFIYSFNKENGELLPNPEQSSFALAPGAGPRHLDFHPNGSWVFVLNELNSTLTACNYDALKGKLSEIHTLPTVDADHKGKKYPAAVRVHPNGKFVYASTRGENSCISCFKIMEDGSMERIQVMENVPLWPRDFQISPCGKYLVSAGERANEIRLYLLDPGTGLLKETGRNLSVRAPANILFIPEL